MGKTEIAEFIKLVPGFILRPNIWTSYDTAADVLYIDFKKPAHADDTELTDDDIIIRYEGEEVIGITVLNAKKRGLQ
jgi:uncharacterized protein YuzE